VIPQRLAVCAEAGGGEREDAIKTTGRLLRRISIENRPGESGPVKQGG